MKNMIIPVTAAVFFVLAQGCASFSGRVNGFLGKSVREIESSRIKSVKLVIPGDYDTVYAGVLSELKKEGRYIYRQDRNGRLIAFYMSNENTTVAGVFFKETAEGKIELEIASPSSDARNLLAESLSVLVPPVLEPVVPEVPAAQEGNKPEQISTADEQKPSN